MKKKTKSVYSLNDLLSEMSFSRDDYKKKIREHLLGGLREYCKYKCAIKNNFVTWTKHWHTEFERLIGDELLQAMLHDTKFKDKRKAAIEEIAKIKSLEDGVMSRTNAVIMKDYQVNKLSKSLESSDLKEFWDRVQDTLDYVLPQK